MRITGVTVHVLFVFFLEVFPVMDPERGLNSYREQAERENVGKETVLFSQWLTADQFSPSLRHGVDLKF
jgi:hypothetical protein